MDICFATNNKNKIEEIGALIHQGFSIQPMSFYKLHEDIPETGTTMEENSRIKAVTVHNKLRIPVIADDSGLEVEALYGAPGVYSARFAGEHGNHVANNRLLLQKLEGIEHRNARFRTVITYISDNTEIQFEGIVEGEIISKERGSKGFGYDPLFVPKGFDRTFAEMSLEEKNGLSHRSRAFEKLAHYLNEQK